MNYLLRSVKYFCGCCVLAGVLIAALLLLGWSRYGLDDGQAFWQHAAALAGMLALLAALYPKLCFTQRRVKGRLDEAGRTVVLHAFRSAGYEPVAEEAGLWRFRGKGFGRRLRRLFDDEIVVRQESDGWLTLDGHRTEVFRVLHRWDAFARGEAQTK